MTPTAQKLIRKLEAEARYWDDVTTTDLSVELRTRATAKRDVLDYVVAQLKQAVAAIEAEAVEEYRTAERIAGDAA